MENIKNYLIDIILVISLIGMTIFNIKEYGTSKMSPNEKIKNEFSQVFEKTENYYLINNILTVEEKAEILKTLKQNTPKEKEIVFNNILKEKEEEISQIGNYQKEKWKEEYDQKEKLSTILEKITDFESPMFRIIFLVALFIVSFFLFILPSIRF